MSSVLSISLDLILALSAMVLAALSLTVRRVFTGIVLFIGLGLMVTIIWARLDAWDVAIAEAAIGAGLTGAMLLAAWRQLQDNIPPSPKADQRERARQNISKVKSNLAAKEGIKNVP